MISSMMIDVDLGDLRLVGFVWLCRCFLGLGLRIYLYGFMVATWLWVWVARGVICLYWCFCCVICFG